MCGKFGSENWREYIPVPVYEERPEYTEFYQKAWELAFAHIKHVPGMPQDPYMDEAFCDTQLWIWDTSFMALFCKYARDVFPGVESLKNFYEVLHGEKRLPAVIPTEKEPAWTNRIPGEPYGVQIHIADNPPLFAWAEYENARMKGDKAYLAQLLYEQKYLQKHYQWLENLRETVTPPGVFAPTCLCAEKYGYRWEGGRSGMDNTPRGRTGAHANAPRPNNPDMLWLDAICQQALAARMIANLFALLEDTENQAAWERKYSEKKKIVNDLYWDAADEFYYDIDRNTHAFYKVMTIASCWTMTAGIASKEQARALVRQLENPQTLGGTVPLVSLSRSDSDYHATGGYWRGSVWLPTAYAALTGLKNYGFYPEARALSCKLLEHMYRTYTQFEPHTIWECYSPEEYKPALNEYGTGEYVRPDFCGWSALGPISVFIEFILGFHTIDAFKKVVHWEKPGDCRGRIGIRNLRFGDIVTDIEAFEETCSVTASGAYTLLICGKAYAIHPGKNLLRL